MATSCDAYRSRRTRQDVGPSGFAADQAVGFVYKNGEFVEVISSRTKTRGFYIERAATGVE
jgi:hypothetical protein